jgi:hypothetical protein
MTMKKLILLSVALLMMAFTAQAQYQKMEVFEMIGTADLVVFGTIQEVKTLTMVVEVKDRLLGDDESATIEVEKYKGTSKNAKRWGKYMMGENVLLFLKKESGAYKLLGVGGEGEKYVLEGEVYLDNRGGALFNRFNYLTLPSGASIYAEKVSLKDFSDAVRNLRSLFTVEYVEETNVAGEVTRKPVTVPAGAASAIDEYASRSDLHNKLIQDCWKALKLK